MVLELWKKNEFLKLSNGTKIPKKRRFHLFKGTKVEIPKFKICFKKKSILDTSTLQCIVSPESLDPSAVEENLNLDIENQTSERRYFRGDHGTCFVNYHITPDGIFWIKPNCRSDDINKLCFFIGQFITKTQWKSFSELHILPDIGKKCFFREGTGKAEWARGVIEDVFEDAALIRNLDTGNGRTYQWENVYPHRRLTNSNSNVPFQIPKYLAIRCAISREPVKLTKK